MTPNKYCSRGNEQCKYKCLSQFPVDINSSGLLLVDPSNPEWLVQVRGNPP